MPTAITIARRALSGSVADCRLPTANHDRHPPPAPPKRRPFSLIPSPHQRTIWSLLPSAIVGISCRLPIHGEKMEDVTIVEKLDREENRSSDAEEDNDKMAEKTMTMTIGACRRDSQPSEPAGEIRSHRSLPEVGKGGGEGLLVVVVGGSASNSLTGKLAWSWTKCPLTG